MRRSYICKNLSANMIIRMLGLTLTMVIRYARCWEVFHLTAIHSFGIKSMVSLTRSFVTIESIWDRLSSFMIKFHQEMVDLLPNFRYGFWSLRSKPHVVWTMFLTINHSFHHFLETMLPNTQKFHKTHPAHGVTHKLDPTSPSAGHTILRLQHRKNLGGPIGQLKKKVSKDFLEHMQYLICESFMENLHDDEEHVHPALALSWHPVASGSWGLHQKEQCSCWKDGSTLQSIHNGIALIFWDSKEMKTLSSATSVWWTPLTLAFSGQAPLEPLVSGPPAHHHSGDRQEWGSAGSSWAFDGTRWAFGENVDHTVDGCFVYTICSDIYLYCCFPAYCIHN